MGGCKKGVWEWRRGDGLSWLCVGVWWWWWWKVGGGMGVLFGDLG